MAFETTETTVDQNQSADTLDTSQPSTETTAPDANQGTSDSTDGAAGSESQTDGQEDADGLKPTTPTWVKRRFDKLTAEKHAERARATELEQKNADLAAALEAVTANKGTSTSPQSGDTSPKGLTAADVEARAAQIAAERVAQAKFVDDCNRVNDEGEKAFKDFDDARSTLTVAYGDQIAAKPEFLQAITALDDGHKVFYHLGKNPELAEKILNMAPVQMAVKLAGLASELRSKETRVSNAPTPIRPLNGSARAVETDPDKMTAKEWMAWRERDLAAKRQQR